MKLLDRLEQVGLRRRLARNTIVAYQRWVSQFLRFCRVGGRWRAPGEVGAREVEAFLTDMAVRRRLSASSRLETTMIYTHVMNKPAIAVTSPLDRLLPAAG